MSATLRGPGRVPDPHRVLALALAAGFLTLHGTIFYLILSKVAPQ